MNAGYQAPSKRISWNYMPGDLVRFRDYTGEIRFGTVTVLSGVDLTVPRGKLVALLGPSGSGKTTLLRIIAGLEHADPGSGQIHFHGDDVTKVPAGKRKVGFVFQHYALFRHMTVFENVAFGLRVKPRNQRPSESDIQRKVHDLLNLVQLDPAYQTRNEGHAEKLIISKDLEKNKALFESIEVGAGARLQNYIDSAEDAYNLSMKHFLYTNFQTSQRED